MADPQPLDGLSAPSAKPAPATKKVAAPEKVAVRKWKTLLIGAGFLVYGAYAIWCMMLISLLPSANPAFKPLVLLGQVTGLLGAVLFAAIGVMGLLRISKAKVPSNVQTMSLLKVAAVSVPGIAMSIVMPLLIMGEPAIGIDIVSPASAQDLVAPISMTFSVEEAVQTLNARGIRVTNFSWDIDGDGKGDQETVNPRLTVNFEREGVYVIAASLNASDGIRRVSRRFIIQAAVFDVQPSPPIVKKPVVLSVANLIPDINQLKEVQWDFTGDGKADETTTTPQVAYTFFQTGSVKIRALIVLQNNTQQAYERTLVIEEPQPLPFEVAIVTEPKNLISPAPFPVLMRIESKEPIAETVWNFGDGTQEKGQRVLHEYKTRGTYVVTAKTRAESGSSATLDAIVRVVEDLPLPDLSFDSNITIGGNRIEGSLPLRLDITPRTSQQFVQFSWEAPDASDVGSTETRLQAVYRKEGTYKLILLAQDIVNRATRREFTVVVKPPETQVDFKILPETGVAPLTVQLDSSDTTLPPDETPTGYLWKCETSAPAVARGGTFSCTYEKEGTYQISLTIRTQSGKEFSRTKTIVVRPPVVSACFLPTRSTAQVNRLIGFSADCSTGNWTDFTVLWDFGDGTQMDWKEGDPDVTHAYTDPGSYTVTLTFTDKTDPTRTFRAQRSVTIEP